MEKAMKLLYAQKMEANTPLKLDVKSSKLQYFY
jgi:hypothetical protein